MKSCCWAVSLGALVPKLLAQSFLVAHMDFVLFLKLWPPGDPAPFLVPLPLPVHSRVVITSLLLYCFAFPNMMVLREHSCSSDVPLFLLHAEHLFVASVEVYPLFSPTEVQPLLVLCVNHTLSSPTRSKASRDCREHQRKGFLSPVPDPDSLGRAPNSPEDKLQMKSCFTLNLSISTEMQSSENLAAHIEQDIWVHARHGLLQFMTWPNFHLFGKSHIPNTQSS